MQILMAEAAHARVARALADAHGDLEIITLDGAGVFKRNGETLAPEAVDPELYWVSLDLFRAGQLGAVFARLLQGTRGRWAQIFAAGIDNPAFARIMGKGVRLAKSNAQAPAIAEYVLCRALAWLHPIAQSRAAQAKAEWTHVPFREIAATRWLMLGYGAIGGEIAKRLAPFGAQLTVLRRNVAPEPLAAAVRPSGDLLACAPDADVVVLACALNAQTRQIANEAFFRTMKPGALLINIGRGGLVDEAALRAGLARDQPAMAMLDVFETEPLAPDSWFWTHPKVAVTAHCAGAGDGVIARGDRLFLENLRRYRAGEPLINEARADEAGS